MFEFLLVVYQLFFLPIIIFLCVCFVGISNSCWRKYVSSLFTKSMLQASCNIFTFCVHNDYFSCMSSYFLVTLNQYFMLGDQLKVYPNLNISTPTHHLNFSLFADFGKLWLQNSVKFFSEIRTFCTIYANTKQLPTLI